MQSPVGRYSAAHGMDNRYEYCTERLFTNSHRAVAQLTPRTPTCHIGRAKKTGFDMRKVLRTRSAFVDCMRAFTKPLGFSHSPEYTFSRGGNRASLILLIFRRLRYMSAALKRKARATMEHLRLRAVIIAWWEYVVCVTVPR